MTVSGVVAVDKPAGCTSHDVVGRARRALGTQKVGHAGTLDPDATGVLVLGVGRATRLLQYATALPKSYVGEVVLGVGTSTLDASGKVVAEADLSAVKLAEAQTAAAALTGDLLQVPPMVSAVQVGGRRLHELAREGVEVERDARPVTVTRFDVLGIIGPGPTLAVEVDCSSGTYVRSLAAELGAALGGPAHLRALRRTAVGPFRVEDAVTLDELAIDVPLPPRTMVGHLSVVEVGGETADLVRRGRRLLRDGPVAFPDDGPWAVVDEHGGLLAVYRAGDEQKAHPEVVLAPE